VRTSPGVVELRASYSIQARPAHMVFHFRNPGGSPPTPGDCKAIAQQYGLWEDSGLGGGYVDFRGYDGLFTKADAWTLDRRSPASFVDTAFARNGLIPAIVAGLLPTAVCPLVRYGTVEHGLQSGRTYAVGMTSLAAEFFGDASRVDSAAQLAIAAQFASLGTQVRSATGYVQVVLTARGAGATKTFPLPLDITDVGCYALMGTQRRRTRPG
jgi:hypothetical protein